jgi:AcrR family transcriptional regulator
MMMLVAKLRWGADAPQDTATARARLLDAAEACFQRYGVVKTTVEDVAATAKVSRATVYRYFANREDLILGVLLREAGRFLGRLTVEINREPSFDRAVVESVLFTVDAVRADQNLALLFAPEAVGLTTSLAGASEALFELTADFLRPLFEDARASGEMCADIDLDEAAEWTLRAVLSLITIQGPVERDRVRQRSFLSTFLVPALAARPATRSPRRRHGPTPPTSSRRPSAELASRPVTSPQGRPKSA